MFRHRCPWCGEKIRVLDALTSILKKKKCPICGKHIDFIVSRRWYIFFFPLCLIAGMINRQVRMDNALSKKSVAYIEPIAIFLVFFVFILYLRFPHKRKWDKLKKIKEVKLNWLPASQKGLRLPRFQVIDGEIFPACFFNAKGILISQTLCVALEKIHWKGKRRCECRISFVLDDVDPEPYFQKGNRFYLYYEYRKIAEGEIQ